MGAPYNPQLSTPESTIANQTYQLTIPERYQGQLVVLSVAHVVLDGVSASFCDFIVLSSSRLTMLYLCGM